MVKSGHKSLKTGYKIGVSENVDLEKKLVLHASELHNMPCGIA